MGNPTLPTARQGAAPPQPAPAQQQQSPPPPPRPQQDGATLIQEQLDKLALACFNAVLEVSKARAGDGGSSGGNEGVDNQLEQEQQQRIKGSEIGQQIGTLLREMEETIDNLPVIPTNEGAASDQQTNSVEATRRRLKELQAEYEQINQELKETVTEASALSTKLRHTLTSHKH